MAFSSYLVVLGSLVCLLLHRLYRFSKLSDRATGFPPGPKTIPFLGNLHQMPISRPELMFSDIARQYGPVTGLKLGCQNMVILNTWQAVRDLIEQKGAIYSSRPSNPVGDIVVPAGLNAALIAYGDVWRGQRKTLTEFLGGERTDRMMPVQDAESTQLIFDMVQDPADFDHHVERSFVAVILATVYGHRGRTFEEGGKIDRFYKIEEQWAAALGPTSYPPINSFPFLGYIPEWLTPWKGWRTRALRVKKDQSQLYTELSNETKERLTQGKGADCFLAQCLKTQEKEWYDDLHLTYLGGVLLEAGAETSASTTMVFIMAMAAFPEVLAQAQEEVDRVCGTLKMPGPDDIVKLPFTYACMLETFRWRPITPLAVPHHTTGQDTYDSFTIPAGTDVIINTWTINHDESFYDTPATFNPSRYLKNEYGSRTTSTDPAALKGRRLNYSFGGGRRACPGQRFAENNLMIHFAKLVWAFDIKATGKLPINPWEGSWTDGLVVKPKDLQVAFKLRGEGREQVIKDAWLEADAFLRQFE